MNEEIKKWHDKIVKLVFWLTMIWKNSKDLIYKFFWRWIKYIFFYIRKYKQKIRIKMQNKDYMIQKMHSRLRNVGKKEQYNVF